MNRHWVSSSHVHVGVCRLKCVDCQVVQDGKGAHDWTVAMDMDGNNIATNDICIVEVNATWAVKCKRS